MGLGGLRLYSLYLEHRLSEVSSQIEKVEDSNACLKEKLASLLSPSRVYSYAHVRLGMECAKNIPTLWVSLNPSPIKEERVASVSFRQAHLFSKILSTWISEANAKD